MKGDRGNIDSRQYPDWPEFTPVSEILTQVTPKEDFALGKKVAGVFQAMATEDFVNAQGTADPTASALVRRDASGRAAFADPAAADDAATKAYVDTAVAGAWASYDPTLVGFGSPTNKSFFWRADPHSLHIRGKFTSGTSTATEARIPLPSGKTSSGTIPTIELGGVGTTDNAGSASIFHILIETSKAYLTIGGRTATLAGLSKMLGNAFIATGVSFSFTATIPLD